MKNIFYSFILLVTLPLDINAQEPNLEHLFSLSLEELLKVKVLGSTLTSESLKTAPSAVTVYTQKEIQRMGLDTLDELMNLVPGFQAYRSDQASIQHLYSARGRRIGGPSSEVLLIMDGQRLYEPRVNGNSSVMPKLPLKQIERVEFIRGPGSAVYGSNAMMGVINIISRQEVNEIQAATGSNNLKQTHIFGNHQFKDGAFDFYAHAESDSGESYRVKDTFSSQTIQTNDPKKILDMTLKVNWNHTQLNFLHSQSESEDFYVLGTLSNGFNRHNGQLDILSIKHKFTWWKTSSYLWLSYTQAKHGLSTQRTAQGDLLSISSPASSDALLVDVDFNNSREVRTQWHNDWKIGPRSSLQFGYEHRAIDVPATIAGNNFDLGELANGEIPISYYGALVNSTTVESKGSRRIHGLYGQYQNQLLDHTHINLGLRFDNFSAIGSQFSPRLGLVQDLNKQHTVKLLYGKAFRAPSEGELRLINNPVVVGNPNLKPEVVQTVDLIWLARWSYTGTALGYFENHYEDSIVQTPSGNGSTVIHINQDESPSKGFEFEVSHELYENWILKAAYTHLLEKPDSSFRESDEQASIIINYADYDWYANLIASHHGTRITPIGDESTPDKTLSEYWLLFGKLGFLYSSDINVHLTVKNILDEKYQTPARDPRVVDGIPNRGREIILGLQWLF